MTERNDPYSQSSSHVIAEIYRRLQDNISRIQTITSRPLTLSEKVLIGHLDHQIGPDLENNLARGKSYISLRPDRVALQDVTGQMTLLQFMQTGRDKVAVPTTIHCDHLIQARVAGEADLLASLEENREVYDFLRSAAAKWRRCAGGWSNRRPDRGSEVPAGRGAGLPERCGSESREHVLHHGAGPQVPAASPPDRPPHHATAAAAGPQRPGPSSGRPRRPRRFP